MNKNISRYRRVVTKINKLEKEFEKLKEADFAVKTSFFKMRLKKGEALDKLLPEAFALVREAAKRKIKMRAFNVQLQGAIAVHEGKVIEMKTGEGKTLAILFPAYLNALEGKGVHVITANDYLAKRDVNWMSSVYAFLGISVSYVTSESNDFDRQVAYHSDVTYVTNNEVGFDFLKDNMIYEEKNRRQREFYYAIVDEADSVLIDEAQIPLVISENKEGLKIDEEMYSKLNPIVEKLQENIDFQVDKKEYTVNLTVEGIKKLEKAMGVHNLYTEGEVDYIYYVSRLLKAHYLFQKDKEYVIEGDQVTIVDEFTGRLMPSHRYYQGIHQAIEAKEKIKIQGESRTLASITFQHLFKRYERLAGLTGTAMTAEKEFRLIYGKEVVAIPTNKNIKREDRRDRFFLTWNDKLKYIAWSVQEHYFKKRAVLIGTRSVERSNLVGNVLLGENISNRILNAKHTAREAEVIAEAGQKQTVTVATNMAGRGTDIKLEKEVRDLGGLIVCGTERHNARRIDNQLIGRSGRQGDPGETRFLISAEDELVKLFYRDEYITELKKHKGWARGVENRKLEQIVTKSQKRMENIFFDQRVLSYEFDRVMESHRKSFYRQRDRILRDRDLKKETLGLVKGEIYRLIMSRPMLKGGGLSDNEVRKIISDLKEIISNDWFETTIQVESKKIYLASEVNKLLLKNIFRHYDDIEEYLTSKKMRIIEKAVTLKVLDLLWIEHQRKAEEIQEAALINSISQTDFFEEYEVEMAKAYRGMLLLAPKVIVKTLFRTTNRLATGVEKEKSKQERIRNHES